MYSLLYVNYISMKPLTTKTTILQTGWGSVAREPPLPIWSGLAQSDTKVLPLVLPSHKEAFCEIAFCSSAYSLLFQGCSVGIGGREGVLSASYKSKWQALRFTQNHCPFRPRGSLLLLVEVYKPGSLSLRMSTPLAILGVSHPKPHLVDCILVCQTSNDLSELRIRLLPYIFKGKCN